MSATQAALRKQRHPPAWPLSPVRSPRRIAVALFTTVVVALVLGSWTGYLALGGAPIGNTQWWGYLGIIAGALLTGAVVASYFDAPIGAAATMCDVRWPGFAVLALGFANDLRSLAPLIDGWSRLLLTLAAIVLLAWALRERVSLERRVLAAVAAGHDGDIEACSTCRPLFAVR